MMDLKEKYPLLTLDDDSLTEAEADAFRQERWRQQAALFASARDFVPNIESFAGSVCHDSYILFVKHENDNLSICVADRSFGMLFGAVNGLLGFDLPDERLQCPVTIRLEGISSLAFYKHSDDENVNYSPLADTSTFSDFKEFLYDEISNLTPHSISIGLVVWSKINRSVLIDVDARSIHYDENLRADFAAAFGEANLDIFDSFRQARMRRESICFDFESVIKFIRSMRPDRAENLKLQDTYVRCELEMIAAQAACENDLSHAVEIYQQLIHSKFSIGICQKLGKCLFRLKQYNEAMLYFYAAVGDCDYAKDYPIHLLIAQSWYALGQLYQAAHALEHCLEINPKYEPALKFIETHEDIREYVDLENET